MLGDNLYDAGASIELSVSLVENHAITPSEELTLNWEIWEGNQWQSLGSSAPDKENAENGSDTGFSDGTLAFTQSGKIQFSIKNVLQRTTINTVEGYWLRVRIVSGNYGEDYSYILKDPGHPEEGYYLKPKNINPPLISRFDYTYTLSKSTTPDLIITFNNFLYSKVALQQSFQPFIKSEEQKPALYLGFSSSGGKIALLNHKTSLYAQLRSLIVLDAANTDTGKQLMLSWSYWNGEAWSRLRVIDESENFTRSGMIEFIAPADIAESSKFGLKRFWLRVNQEKGQYKGLPELHYLILNTVMARQAVTIRNETLGSSDGSEQQHFYTTRYPILEGQRLEVREYEIPSETEKQTLQQEEENAIAVAHDFNGDVKEIWIRWHEVPDFYASGSRDRHYTLDHLSGELRFGNGLNGLIPPIGSGNIRMAEYRTGGGKQGNRAANSITQLKTTVPYIDSVNNIEAAAGGSDAESLESFLQRAPRTLRHRQRAVTLQDYEDLAKLASTSVARAKCVPLYDLKEDPDGTRKYPGTVSLIIVPDSTALKPIPSNELIARVSDYLDKYRIPTTNLVIVEPEFIRVQVSLEIALRSLEGASQVEKAVDDALTDYLHPLKGGTRNTGWDFGRIPYQSDLYSLLEDVAGVDHIRSLAIEEVEEPAGARNRGRFLVYSGVHDIQLIYTET